MIRKLRRCLYAFIVIMISMIDKLLDVLESEDWNHLINLEKKKNTDVKSQSSDQNFFLTSFVRT